MLAFPSCFESKCFPASTLCEILLVSSDYRFPTFRFLTTEDGCLVNRHNAAVAVECESCKWLLGILESSLAF